MTEPVFNQNSTTTREFARAFAELERRITDLERGARTPQLGYSSLDNGELLVKHLDDVKLRLGKQSDGTYALKYLNGTPPPPPSDPVASAHQLGIVVYWDGTFAGGVPRPADFQRVDLHVSDVADFTPDGTTVVGSLLAEGAMHTGFSDMTQKYVKLVAVTQSDVASTPSGTAEAFPLPAGVIGAGVVAAENLVAEVILSTQRIISGDPLAARAEMNDQGFQAYSPEGDLTFAVESDTGNALVTGEYRSALNGPRITIGEQGDYQMMRFYRAEDDTDFSEIVGYTTEGSNKSAVWMRGSSTREDQGGSIFFTNEDESTIQWFTPDRVYSRLRAARNFTDIQSGYVDLRCDRRRAGEAGPLGPRVGFTTLGSAAGETLGNSILHYHIWSQTDSGNADAKDQPRLTATPMNVSLIFGNNAAAPGHLYVANNDAHFPQPKPVHALSFDVTSGIAAKENIEDCPDSMEVVQQCRAKMWEYNFEEPRQCADGQYRKPKRFGPMAEDLPQDLVTEAGHVPGGKVVSLGSMVGVLWDAVGKIADRLDAIEAKLG